MEKYLDRQEFGGAILMDLSKAFDTLNHGLLLAKLHAYGFDKNKLLITIHSARGSSFSFITHNREYWNTVSFVVCRL